MIKYLDPKNDLMFKKVFGENKHLCISLLNSLLKFEGDALINSIEYDTLELIPEDLSTAKTIVDVKCTDLSGRVFIVEMQLNWIKEYDKRVVFNASKLYVRQVSRSSDIKLLKPIYSLNFINDIFEKELKMKETYYHHYKIVNIEHTEKQIEGLEFIFVELPKYKKLKKQENSYFDMWLRFLTEINENTREVSNDFFDKKELSDAIKCVEVASLSEKERDIYDRILEANWKHDAAIETKSEEAHEKGRKEGIEKGKEEKAYEIAKNLKKLGIPIDQILQLTGLTKEKIEDL